MMMVEGKGVPAVVRRRFAPLGLVWEDPGP
jgi:hypothetical protein